MTRGSIREYTEAVRGRYIRASRKEKGKILDEFTNVIGYHRKAAIRLLRRGNQPRMNKRRGRPREYGVTVTIYLYPLTKRFREALCQQIGEQNEREMEDHK